MNPNPNVGVGDLHAYSMTIRLTYRALLCSTTKIYSIFSYSVYFLTCVQHDRYLVDGIGKSQWMAHNESSDYRTRKDTLFYFFFQP